MLSPGLFSCRKFICLFITEMLKTKIMVRKNWNITKAFLKPEPDRLFPTEELNTFAGLNEESTIAG